MPKLKHYDNTGTARFITAACYQGFPLFNRSEVVEKFLSELDAWREEQRIDLLAWVVMPEHVHLVLYPRGEIALGPALGILKSKSARAMLPLLDQEVVGRLLTVLRNGESRRVFWQRRVYDHNCRIPDAVRQKIEYCHKNPVRRGLVNEMGDWPWSSYRAYNGELESALRVDTFEG